MQASNTAALSAMTKIVINACHGAFGLSPSAVTYWEELTGQKYTGDGEVARDCPALVRVVEELGERAYGGNASLKIVEIPEDVDWVIGNYDGFEWVAEKHRTWE